MFHFFPDDGTWRDYDKVICTGTGDQGDRDSVTISKIDEKRSLTLIIE